MKTFIPVFKNDCLRVVPRLGALGFFTLVTLASVLLAVYITGQQQVKGHIVLVSQSDAAASVPSSKYLDITIAKEAPPYSALVERKYDAYVTVGADGGYQIETLRSDSFKALLTQLLKNPDANLTPPQTERGPGVNIIGFMMMFLLMVAFSCLFVLADDKEQGQLRRIAASPASFGWYLAAHCAFCLAFLLPEFVLLVILKVCGWDIGFSLAQYAGLMAVLGFLGISFALLLNTLIKKPDNANMLGNSVTVLTSVLSGSFYSFSKNSPVLDGALKLLPQKAVMDFAQAMQNGTASSHSLSIVYPVAFSLVLFAFSCLVLRGKYVRKV